MDKKLKGWGSVKARYDGAISPVVGEAFKLTSDATVITIGSCFARNIEEHLSVIGVTLPAFEFVAPYAESTNRPNGILNKFTPSAIKEELAWAHSVLFENVDFNQSIDKFRYEITSEEVIDLQLNYAPVTNKRFIERRAQILEIYKEMRSADCVTITLGLVERWLDTKNSLSIFGAPTTKELLREKDRFQFAPLSFSEAKAETQAMIEIIHKINPKIKVLITTSPVPLNKTFKNEDVVVANMQSKSTLRAVCGEICEEFNNVCYFPSYEMVTFRDPELAFGEDLRHVNDHVVGDVVQLLVDSYFQNVDHFDKLVRRSLGDLTAKKKNTPAMLEALRSADSGSLNKSMALILARVAWRCGQKSLSHEMLCRYFSFDSTDIRDIKALNYIAVQNKMFVEYEKYLTKVLEVDPTNERAVKFIEHLTSFD